MMETKPTTGKSRITGPVSLYPSGQTVGSKKDPSTDPMMSSGDFSGIRINIWNSAKVRLGRLLTHLLAGGGTHNRGYHALRWEYMLHGNAG